MSTKSPNVDAVSHGEFRRGPGTTRGRRGGPPINRRALIRAGSVAGLWGIVGCLDRAPGETDGSAEAAQETGDEGLDPTETGAVGETDEAEETDDAEVTSDPDCVISGRLTDETTLGADCELYTVPENLRVEATLSIEPGVTLVFGRDTTLEVSSSGSLVAVGTEDEPITFTGEQASRGYWKGITFDRSGDAENRLESVVVEYGGGPSQRHGPANVRLEGTGSSRSLLSVSNSTLRESEGYGLFVDRWSALETFDGNVLTGNALGAASVASTSADDLDSSSTYAGNDRDVVLVEGVTIDEDREIRWPALDADLLVSDGTLVHGRLTVDPGATLLFGQDASIDVRSTAGGLTAEGTAEEPITFAGEQPTPGYWKGLGFVDSNSVHNVLRHAIVEGGGSAGFYGGFAGGPPANVTIAASSSSTSRLTLSDVSLRDSGGECLFSRGNVVLEATRIETDGCEGSVP